MKCVFATSRWGNIDNVYPEIRKILPNEAEVLPDLKTLDGIENRKDLRDVEVIFSTWGMFKLTEEQIREIFPSLKAIFYAAGTVKYFAEPFLKCGVRVFSAWMANSVPVAEVTFSEIVLALKGFFQREVKKPEDWDNSDPEVGYPGCYKSNVGIIGAGSIGKMVISKLRTLDVNIKVFDAFLSKEQIEELGCEKVSLEELFSTCDVISNHLANVPATVGMIDHNCFDRMKKYGTFINTGRGAQVVEADMIKAMEDCPTRTALLDVTDPCEPPVPGSKLYSLPNIRITPHVAGSIGKEFQRLGQYMYEVYTLYKEGKETKYEVTLQMLPNMA